MDHLGNYKYIITLMFKQFLILFKHIFVIIILKN